MVGPLRIRFLGLMGSGFIVISSMLSNAQASNCVFYLNKAPNTSFDKILNQIRVANIASNFGSTGLRMSISDQMIADFWKKSWPLILKLAEKEEATVREFFEERIALYELGASAYLSAHGSERALSAQLSEGFRSTIYNLIDMGTPQKMKPQHWRVVLLAYLNLIDFSMLISSYESKIRKQPSFDPLTHLSPDRLLATFKAAQDVTLDVIQNAADEMELERLMRQTSPHSPAPPNAHQENFLPEPETDLQNETSTTTATATARDETSRTETSLEENERRLNVVLREGYLLQANTAYEAATIRGQKLEVILSEDVAEATRGPHRHIALRLLRTIFTGRGDQAGIKMLSDLGQNIIEVKAVMRGHRRILGCLKGGKLHLRAFMEMGNSRASYARVIDRNFCR